jgi:hypothetical protein
MRDRFELKSEQNENKHKFQYNGILLGFRCCWAFAFIFKLSFLEAKALHKGLENFIKKLFDDFFLNL